MGDAAAPRVWAPLGRAVHSAGTWADRPAAAFDFDSTLCPYRGRGPAAELTLRFLAGLSRSFNIVIITNRPGAGAAALAPVRDYVAALDRVTDGRAAVYAATARDRYRKPHTGAWEHYTAGRAAAPWFAFYCGDAAGRPGDHAATDYMFALNAGLAFTTPEALFGGGADPWAPAGWAAPAVDLGPAGAAEPELGAAGRACVILVGAPASGKTRLARRLGLRAVGGDAQGAGHLRAFLAALARGEGVVVDNTNPTARARAVYAAAAAAAGYAVTVCHVATAKAVCFHLNAARCQLDPAAVEVPPVAIHAYWKRLEPPTEAEAAALGARLVTVPFALAADAPPEVTRFRYPTR